MKAGKFLKMGEDVYIADTVIWKRPQLAHVGSHIAIDDFTVITTSVNIGDYIHIHCHVSIIGGQDAIFQMGNFSTIAAGSRIIVRGDEHKGAGLVGPTIPDKHRDKVVGSVTVMEDFSSLGTNVILYPDVRIAEGVVVAAGTVVRKSIQHPWTIWGTGADGKLKFLGYRESAYMKIAAKELGYE